MRRVDDLAQERLGLHRVGQPAHRLLQRPLGRGRGDGVEVGGTEPAGHEHRGELPATRHIVVVEPVDQGVLGVGGLDRGQLRRRTRLLHERLLRRHQLLQVRPVQRPRGDHAELVPHPRDAVAQGVGRASGRRGRVVELVGEPGGELAEGEQPLPLADHGVGVAQADEHALQQVHRHRVPLAERGHELLRPQGEERRVAGRADGGAVGLVDLVAEVELHRAGVDPALVGADDLDLVAADESAHHQRAAEQHVEALGRVALFDEVVSRRDVDGLGVLGEPRQLRVIEVFEQEQRAQLAGVRAIHCSSKYRCTRVTAIAPSPTAEATRFTDSDRTSPATNTPGMLASR